VVNSVCMSEVTCCSCGQVDKDLGCIRRQVWEDNQWPQTGELSCWALVPC